MAISVVSFLFSGAAQPEARGPTLLGAGFLYRILSPTGLQTHWGSRGRLLLGGGFLYHILSLTHLMSNSLTSCLTELYNSSIALSISILMASQAGICHFRRFWTGMFDHDQVEITVMQFRGHYLPVHQYMSVPWDLNLVPFFQPAYAISFHNCHRNVSLPSGAPLWNGMFGRVKGQYTTCADE